MQKITALLAALVLTSSGLLVAHAERTPAQLARTSVYDLCMEDDETTEEECAEFSGGIKSELRDLKRADKFAFVAGIVAAKKACGAELGEDATAAEKKACLKEGVKAFVKDRFLKMREYKKACITELDELDLLSRETVRICVLAALNGGDEEEITDVDGDGNEDPEVGTEEFNNFGEI